PGARLAGHLDGVDRQGTRAAAGAASARRGSGSARAQPLAARAGSAAGERATVRLLGIETELARRMTRGMNLIASVGSTAPFVGLFGTVWGIMDAFIG